jgi:hypothetical protein
MFLRKILSSKLVLESVELEVIEISKKISSGEPIKLAVSA